MRTLAALETPPSTRISPLEDRFDRWRRRWGLIVGPLLALGVYFWAAAAYDASSRRLAAVLALVVTYWVTEALPIPVTALLGPALCALLGVADARTVFAPFADPIIFVFLGSFLLARGMMVNGLDRRVALRVLSLPGVGSSPFRVMVAAGLGAIALSMWISNTASTAILFPIMLGVIGTLDALVAETAPGAPSQRYATGVLLMTAYASSVGGIATPVGSPPNLIGLGMIENLAQRRITFFEWMVLNLPIVLVMFIVLAVLLGVLHRSPVRRLTGLQARLAELRARLEPWNRAQTYTVIGFLTAVSLWLLPGILAVALGAEHPTAVAVNARLHEGVAALLGAVLLFLLPVSWRQARAALSWREAVKIDWGTILLFGGGLSLGRLMYETGLARAWADSLLQYGELTTPWGLTAVAIVLAILITETTSNTAAASMIVPVVIAVAQAAHVSPLPPALGATLGASLAFMLPVSTPPNAIVYGSGRVHILAMLRAGVLVDAFGFVVVWGLLRLLCPLLGFV